MVDDPTTYQAVTVSSTFTDLRTHRRDVSDALMGFELFPKVMEYDGARADADVIDSSLRFVRDSSAFIGIISHKYGQIPLDPDRNPRGLSISELEFNKAMELGRPILLFVMADDHPVTLADVERDPKKLTKLEAFKTRAKRMREGSEVHRIYETFSSADDFAKKANKAVGRLAEVLKKQVELQPREMEGDSKLKVFVSYSRADEKWLKRLQIHLKPVIREGTLELWDDTQIRAGQRWRDEIRAAIAAADIAILLISADFYASDFVADNELPPLLNAAHKERRLDILILHINHSFFEDDNNLSVYQAINSPDRPIEDLSLVGEQEKIFRDLAREVRGLAHPNSR